jgi:hypothetical protein
MGAHRSRFVLTQLGSLLLCVLAEKDALNLTSGGGVAIV